MKLNGSVLVAVAMMVGSFGMMGCQQNATSSDPIAPEESVQNAPVEDDTAAATSTENDTTNALRFGVCNTVRVHYYAPHAPPAARYEVRGVAPSARHFWAPGYYRWTGRQFVWYGGRWEVRRAGYEYINPHWGIAHGRYEYIPGHWIRRY
jgi:hypothetical protein